MTNHKRKRPKNRRAGCLCCKPHKMNGWGKNRLDGHHFATRRKRLHAGQDMKDEGNP